MQCCNRMAFISSATTILILNLVSRRCVLSEISQHIREKFKVFSLTDDIIFNNKLIRINEDNFQVIPSSAVVAENPITYIDGGQAELLSGGNLHLSFIRVVAQKMRGSLRVKMQKYEWYLLTTASYKEGDIWYQGKLYGPALLDENDLHIASYDASIREGKERAPISKIASIARRFLELVIAAQCSGNVLLDGTLQAAYKNEEKYLERCSASAAEVSALAKTSSLFTSSGNNPIVLLNKLTTLPCWKYRLDEKSYFVKLQEKARHIFRFEGEGSILPLLISNSADPLFLGYPYGLILADKLARVSNTEKDSLRMQLLLRQENKELLYYLNAMNAHEILDGLG